MPNEKPSIGALLCGLSVFGASIVELIAIL
jgi:hypothetical protein